MGLSHHARRQHPHHRRRLINWARRSAVWLMPFATACCGIELTATAMSDTTCLALAWKCSLQSSTSDLMIVAGRISTRCCR